jgi:purine catabolism regulator
MPPKDEQVNFRRQHGLTATLPIRSLIVDTNLGLQLVSDVDVTDRTISWVYVSELPNPGPWLDGGELVLTLGMWLRERQCTAREYVRRLTKAHAGALAMLTAPSGGDLDLYPEIPDEIVAATNEYGLPLLHVPGEITFLEVTKAVAYALVSENLALISEVSQVQESLVREAAGPGSPRVLATRLGNVLGSWFLLTGPHGDVVDSSPGLSPRRAREVVADLRSQAARGAAQTLPLLAADESVVAYRLTTRDHHVGHLILGRGRPLSGPERRIASVAAGLLALLLDRDDQSRAVHDRLHDSYAQALMNADRDTARQLAAILDVELPAGPVHVAVIGSRLPGEMPQITEWETARTALGGSLITASRTSRVVVLDARLGTAVELLQPALELAPNLITGVAGPVPVEDVGAALRRATSALVDARRSERRIVDLSATGQRTLLDVIPRADAIAFAEELLRPLREYDRTHRGELVRSVRCWLEHYGQWDPAATELGVHRHTLRHRISRAEELLGSTLNSTDLRMELWAALQISGKASAG